MHERPSKARTSGDSTSEWPALEAGGRGHAASGAEAKGQVAAVPAQFHGERHKQPLVAIVSCDSAFVPGGSHAKVLEVLSGDGFKLKWYSTFSELLTLSLRSFLPDIVLVSPTLSVRSSNASRAVCCVGASTCSLSG